MTIELPPKQSRELKQLVSTGAFTSPLDVVSEGLRLLQALEAGATQIRTGKTRPFDRAAVNRIKARGRRMLAAERRKRAGSR